MTTRLGFSIATTVEPEILLIDEGIGAGDARFAERATARMKEFIGRTSILVLASHSDELIESICNKAALLRAGRIITVGPVREVLSQYHAGNDRADAETREQIGASTFREKRTFGSLRLSQRVIRLRWCAEGGIENHQQIERSEMTSGTRASAFHRAFARGGVTMLLATGRMILSRHVSAVWEKIFNATYSWIPDDFGPR